MAEGETPTIEGGSKQEDIPTVQMLMRRIEDRFNNPVINLEKQRELEEATKMLGSFFRQVAEVARIQQVLESLDTALANAERGSRHLLEKMGSHGDGDDPEARIFHEAYYTLQSRIDEVRSRYLNLKSTIEYLLSLSKEDLENENKGGNARKRILEDIRTIKIWMDNQYLFPEGIDGY